MNISFLRILSINIRAQGPFKINFSFLRILSINIRAQGNVGKVGKVGKVGIYIFKS